MEPWSEWAMSFFTKTTLWRRVLIWQVNYLWSGSRESLCRLESLLWANMTCGVSGDIRHTMGTHTHIQTDTLFSCSHSTGNHLLTYTDGSLPCDIHKQQIYKIFSHIIFSGFVINFQFTKLWFIISARWVHFQSISI